jgi:hypothetical protein
MTADQEPTPQLRHRRIAAEPGDARHDRTGKRRDGGAAGVGRA